jgi:hypothetical protein
MIVRSVRTDKAGSAGDQGVPIETVADRQAGKVSARDWLSGAPEDRNGGPDVMAGTAADLAKL